MTLQRNLEIFRGDTKVLEGQAKNSADDTPIDLTGALLWFTVKKKRSDVDPGVLQKTVGSGILITDALQGEFKIEVAPSDTASLNGRFYWDLQLKNTIGQIFTLASGIFNVVIDVTKAT